MIILTIRTDKPESEIGLYDGTERISYEIWEAHRHLAETIHLKIKQLLDAHQLTWENINGIVVYEGPGSFTGLRIGVSVANTLAYSLNASSVGAKGENWIKEGVDMLANGSNQKTVVPFYGSYANITTPKK